MPEPSRRGISTRQRQHKQPPPPDSAPTPPSISIQDPAIPLHIPNLNNTQELLKEQKIPNPLPPVGSIIRKSTSISPSLFPLPDYEYYNENEDDVDDCDIIVHGSDDQEDGQTSRNERLRRVHTYALRYLAGDRVYIHCARLRGPVVNNPWKKKLKEPEVIGQGKRSKGRMGSATMQAKRRRLMEGEDEVLATPTQKSRGTEAMDDVVVARRGPRRKHAMPKKAVYDGEEENGNDDDEDDDDEKKQDTNEEEYELSGEFLAFTSDHGMGEGLKIKEAGGRRNQTAMKRAKTNLPKKIERKAQNNKTAAARNRISRINNKTSTITSVIQQKKLTRASTQRKTTLSQENVVQKLTRKKGGLGGGKAALQIGAAAVESEEEVVEESTLPNGRKSRKGTDTIHIAAQEDVETNLSQNTKAGKRGASTRRMVRPTRQKQNTASTTPTIQPMGDLPDILGDEDTAGFPAEFPDVSVTPVAHLSFEDPTPPSVFYGPTSNNLHNSSNSANLGNKFFAVRRGATQPVAKPAGSKSQAVSTGKSKPMRVESVSTAATKKTTNERVTRSNAAAETGIGRRKRKASPVMPDEEGDSNKAAGKDTEGQVDKTNEWIPGSSDFKYKKGAGKAATVRNHITAGNTAAGEGGNKGKGRAKEDTKVQQQPKQKKPRIIDFAALSPFGGGQVVSRSGKIYTGNENEQEEEEGLNTERMSNDVLDNQRIPHNTLFYSSTAQEKRTPAGDDDKTSEEISSDAYISKNIPTSSVTTRSTAAANKLIPAASNATEIQNGQPSRDPTTEPISEEQNPPQAAQGAFVVPLIPATAAETQSPLMSTQRQLSAAKKSFISILDTPVSEQETPIKPHSTGLSRLRKRPELGLAKGNNETETSSLETTKPTLLLPETPAQVASKGHIKVPHTVAGSSQVGVIPDTSPSGPVSAPIWARHRRAHREANRDTINTPTGPPVPTTMDVQNIVFTSPIITKPKGSKIKVSQHGGVTQTMPPPAFSPFKTFDTPTKSQFGNFMQGFSPLRYSPERELETIEESQTQSQSSYLSQSQSSMVPIRLFGDATSSQNKNSNDTSTSPENRQPANHSTWLGLSQSRISNIGLFQSSPGTPAQRPAAPSSPTLGSSPPEVPPPVRTKSPPTVLPKSIFSPSQDGTPSTPRFRRTGSSQFRQNSMSSPGTKLVGDMLELMGGGIWDMDNELSKMKSDDTATEAGGGSSKFTTPAAAGKGKLNTIGKGMFSSGSKKFGSGSGTRRR